MNALMPFAFESHAIRVTDQKGDPWFILRDLLEAMQSKTTTTAAIESIEQGLGEGFVNGIPLQTAGGIQNIIIVAEPAATYLLSRSNTEKGRELNRFIHIEVIPAIRKTGRYELKPAELTREQILLMALESERERERLAKEVEAARPMVEFHEEVKQAEGEFTADEAAALLFNGAVSGQQLRAWLKQQGWLDSRPRINRPTQWAIHRGYLRLRLDVVHRRLFQVPVLTGNGIELLRHLMRTGELFTADIPRLVLMQEARG